MAAKFQGFSIVELLIAMGVFAIIASLTTVNFVGSQHIATINTTLATLNTDMRQQQLKAMTGDTEGRLVNSSYGVHFESNKYVLFHGTYDSSDSSNFPVSLEGTLSFATIGDILFQKGSGELTGISTITIQDSLTGHQKTIKLNNLGVITQTN